MPQLRSRSIRIVASPDLGAPSCLVELMGITFMPTRVAVLLVSVAALTTVLAAPSTASAAELPPLKAIDGNAVPACATPDRLQAYLKSRNGDLDKRFDAIAAEYKKQGEQLGLRWDYAFFHMLAETGSLSFNNQIRTKAVKAQQNNFAGLPSGDDGVERFADIATGVRAHLQHIKLYTGEKIDNPTAERTRKVQDSGALADFQKSLKRPVTYADFVAKWAPTLKAYPATLESLADKFYADCKKPDAVAAVPAAKVAAADAPPAKAEKISGADLARKALDESKADNAPISALGAAQLAKAAAPIKILNAPAFDDEPTPAAVPAAIPAPKAEVVKPVAKVAPVKPVAMQPAPPQPAPQQVAAATPPVSSKPAVDKPAVQPAAAAASAASAAKHASPKVADATSGKCRVLTASYGGTRALIIKQSAAGMTSYTVLDVNEGQESREAEAYIAAYAKGGAIAGEFKTQNQALDTAFDLCPEG